MEQRGGGGVQQKGLFYSDLDLMKPQWCSLWWIIQGRDVGFAQFRALHWEDWVARSSWRKTILWGDQEKFDSQPCFSGHLSQRPYELNYLSVHNCFSLWMPRILPGETWKSRDRTRWSVAPRLHARNNFKVEHKISKGRTVGEQRMAKIWAFALLVINLIHLCLALPVEKDENLLIRWNKYEVYCDLLSTSQRN